MSPVSIILLSSFMSNKYCFYTQTLKLIKSISIGLLMFFIFRLIFIFRFANAEVIFNHIQDLPLAFWRSTVSDIQAIGYLLVPIYALNFLSLIRSNRLRQSINLFSRFYIPTVFTIGAIISFVNQEFYAFFKVNFNPVLFDFLDESPLLLIQSMWEEHPIIIISISLILIYWLFFQLFKRIYFLSPTSTRVTGTLKNIIAGLFITLFFAIGMRGSLGTFPLEKEDLLVSDNEFINICVPNPLYSLKDAYSSVKNQFNFESPNSIAPKRGFKSIEDAVAVFYDVNIDSVKQNGINHYIFQTSQINQKQKKYNVVFLIMESMSNALINFHTPNNNLLGALEKHTKEDILFRNFQSLHNGTIGTLEHIVAQLPYSYVFDSKYRYSSFGLSIAKPFKEAGYKTNFTTGVSLGWRHIGEALKHQYFDEVYGKRAVLSQSPTAKANNTWGVYDHCLFDYIYQELTQSDSSMFILSLSSTNHTPYELPSDYQAYPIDPNLYQNESFSLDSKTCKDALRAYQYSNDAVGRFMDKIKASKLADNTIVIVTGDHNNRSILNYNTPELLKIKYSVPLYIYLPKELRDSLYIDTNRWANHTDIMSSIFPYILYNVPYPCLGNNLFDPNQDNSHYYSYNVYQTLYDSTANPKEIKRKVKAYDSIIRYYYSQFFQSLN